MAYNIPQDRDPRYHLKLLVDFLNNDNMGGVRVALLELLDIAYQGNHAEIIDPYKPQILRMILTYINREAYNLADALSWQIGELGVTWPELETIRSSIQRIKKEQG